MQILTKNTPEQEISYFKTKNVYLSFKKTKICYGISVFINTHLLLLLQSKPPKSFSSNFEAHHRLL